MNEIQFLMYDADEKVEVLVQDETIWATQKIIAELFDVDRTSISRHLKNIFETGELDEKVVSAEIAHTTQHGAMEGKTQTKPVKYYNLDAIISVGYRVNSQKATKFRIWATDVLKEYIQKGFKIDVERMKQGEHVFGKDYFRELIETVRSIRASERRIWQQISDVFAEISYDYDRNSEITKKFYATVQNSFIMQLQAKLLLKLFITVPIKTKNTWGSLLGRTRPMVVSYNLMYQLRRIIYRKKKFAVWSVTYQLILIMLSVCSKMRFYWECKTSRKALMNS
ncbi:toxin Fic [Paenibacillus polymyxa]|nr:toxin Fic [Paenibacillus polymyxa]